LFKGDIKMKTFRTASMDKKTLAFAVAQKRGTTLASQEKKSRKMLEKLYKEEYGKGFHKRRKDKRR
jgi:hypothetical protein